MIRKINFKQPKYIFPLVVFIPLCALVYFVMQTFGGGEDAQQTVATDRINTELPQANAEEAGDKMYEMSRRFGDEDAFTAVGAIGEEQKKAEELEHGYSEDELNKLDAAEAERIRQQQEIRLLQEICQYVWVDARRSVGIRQQARENQVAQEADLQPLIGKVSFSAEMAQAEPVYQAAREQSLRIL